MKNILVIKLGALGDFIIALGSIMNLRKVYPDARFTLMTHRSLIQIAKQTGMFSDFIVDNRVSYFNLKEQVRLFREVIQGNFDGIIDFQCNKRTTKKYFPLIRWLAPSSFMWCDVVKRTCLSVSKKKSCSRGTLTQDSIALPWEMTDLSFLHGENKHFGELPERFVLMIPGCSPTHPYKRWPVENYKAIVQRLSEKGVYSVVMGTKAEAVEVDAICAASPMAVSMLNKTSLLDIPDLVRRSIACVGNDTGPSHIAAYSGRPVIAIFDQRTAASITRGPLSINLVSPGTIDKVTVDMVWEKLQPIVDAAVPVQ